MSGAPKKDGAFIYVNGKVGRKRETRKRTKGDLAEKRRGYSSAG